MEPSLADFDLIIQPGWRNSGPRHWQSHWQRRLGATRVETGDWDAPQLEDWLQGLDRALALARKPVIVIAHSLGCVAVAHYAQRQPQRIAGALLVAPADVERPFVPRELMGFAPTPRQPLPFPARMVASSNDPFCKTPRAAAGRLLAHAHRLAAPGWSHQCGVRPLPVGRRLAAAGVAGAAGEGQPEPGGLRTCLRSAARRRDG